MLRRTAFFIALALTVGAWWSTSAASAQQEGESKPEQQNHKKEPTGWDKATFLMKLDIAKEIYPDLQKVEAKVPVPVVETGLPPFPLERYSLNKQKIGDLGPCQVIFQFFQQQLTHLEFYCGDAQGAQAYLVKEYGEPSLKTDGGWQWMGKRSYITFAPKTGIFTLASKRGHDSLQGNLYLYYLATKEPQPGEQQPPKVDLQPLQPEEPKPQEKGEPPKQ